MAHSKVRMDDVTVVKQWFERDMRFSSWKNSVEVLQASMEQRSYGFEAVYRFAIYTDLNRYSISATARDEEGGVHTYLGCISSSRKPRAGEDHHRGNDLRDGRLTEETWHGILADIVSYELVKVHRQELDIPEEPRPRAQDGTCNLHPDGCPEGCGDPAQDYPEPAARKITGSASAGTITINPQPQAPRRLVHESPVGKPAMKSRRRS